MSKHSVLVMPESSAPPVSERKVIDIGDHTQPRKDFTEQPFEIPRIYTGTCLAWHTNTNKTQKELIEILEPEGVVKILNTNFGSKCQPGWEFRMVTKQKKKKVKYDANGVPFEPKKRKTEGHGGCFGSVIEAIILPDNEVAPKSIVDIAKIRYAENKKKKKFDTDEKRQKYYCLAAFPTVGRIQVIGVTDQNLANGRYIIDLWTKYFHREGVCTDITKPIDILIEFPTLINYKFKLNSDSDEYRLDINKFVIIVNDIKSNPPSNMPFTIKAINRVSDKQVASFKILPKNPELVKIPERIQMMNDDDPIKKNVIEYIDKTNAKRKVGTTTIKFWFKGKVNILSARSKTNAFDIYDFFNGVVRDHFKELIYSTNDDSEDESDTETDDEGDVVVQPIRQLSTTDVDKDTSVESLLSMMSGKSQKKTIYDLLGPAADASCEGRASAQVDHQEATGGGSKEYASGENM